MLHIKEFLGNNPTKRPIRIEFKNLASIDKSYGKYDGLGWKRKRNSLYLCIR